LVGEQPVADLVGNVSESGFFIFMFEPADEFVAMGKWNRRTNGWRPVADKPPEDGRYLVFINNNEVTHWQPIPKPPEGGGQNAGGRP
jgi:hypothetical protein